MLKYYDITPTRFLHDYLDLVPLVFVRVKNLVYLINIDQLNGMYGLCDTGSVYGCYDVNTFSRDFGTLQIPGLLSCLEWFWLDINNNFDEDSREHLEYDLGANIPVDDGMPELRKLFTPCYEDWYYNLIPYNFFGSDKIKTICEIAKDGAIFANEVVPLADEDTMIALEIEEDNDE